MHYAQQSKYFYTIFRVIIVNGKSCRDLIHQITGLLRKFDVAFLLFSLEPCGSGNRHGGPRSFAVSGPCVWNDLPPTLRASSGTFRHFQSTL